MSSDSVAVFPDGRRRPAVSSPLTSEQPPNPKEKCPRCESRDTKFCYYNNYNTSQPRHFCRSCRRYWTLGGSLRNVPIGGSSRSSTNNNKRLRPNPNPLTINPTQVFVPIESLRFELGLGLRSGTPASMADMRFGLGPTTMIWPSAMMGDGAGGRDTWRVGDGSSGPVDGEVR